MTTRKQEVITFKVDHDLADKMRGIQNRSEFIRAAVLSALDNVCPLCKGAGVLTMHQSKHWQEFAQHHHIEECEECEEIHIVCEHEAQ